MSCVLWENIANTVLVICPMPVLKLKQLHSSQSLLCIPMVFLNYLHTLTFKWIGITLACITFSQRFFYVEAFSANLYCHNNKMRVTYPPGTNGSLICSSPFQQSWNNLGCLYLLCFIELYRFCQNLIVLLEKICFVTFVFKPGSLNGIRIFPIIPLHKQNIPVKIASAHYETHLSSVSLWSLSDLQLQKSKPNNYFISTLDIAGYLLMDGLTGSIKVMKLK